MEQWVNIFIDLIIISNQLLIFSFAYLFIYLPFIYSFPSLKMKTCELYARKYLDEGNVTQAGEVMNSISIVDKQPCPRKQNNLLNLMIAS